MIDPHTLTILIITKNFDVGGTESHVRSLANGLVNLGFKVIVLANQGRQNALLSNSVIFVPMKIQYLSIIKNSIIINNIIKKHRVDLIHAHSGSGIYLGAFISLFSKVPLIATVHGRVRYDLRSKLARFIAKLIICININTANDMSACPILGKKTIAIPNGSDIQPLRRVPTTTHVCFLYISRVDMRHFEALKMLIEVWGNPDVAGVSNLQIIGDGDHADQLKDLLYKKSNPSIKYHGFQPNPLDFMENSDVIIGVGRVACDAICAHKLVYTFNSKYRGAIINTNNFDSLYLSNFVNTGAPSPTIADIETDIQTLINLALENRRSEKTNVIPEKIERLTFKQQLSSTIKAYESVISTDSP